MSSCFCSLIEPFKETVFFIVSEWWSREVFKNKPFLRSLVVVLQVLTSTPLRVGATPTSSGSPKHLMIPVSHLWQHTLSWFFKDHCLFLLILACWLFLLTHHPYFSTFIPGYRSYCTPPLPVISDEEWHFFFLNLGRSTGALMEMLWWDAHVFTLSSSG